MNVYTVTVVDVEDGCDNVHLSIFDTKEKAKEYFDKQVKNYKEMLVDDFYNTDNPDFDNFDDADNVFSCWECGYYAHNHVTIWLNENLVM